MVGIEFERKRQCPSNHDWQLVQFLSYEGLEIFRSEERRVGKEC